MIGTLQSSNYFALKESPLRAVNVEEEATGTLPFYYYALEQIEAIVPSGTGFKNSHTSGQDTPVYGHSTTSIVGGKIGNGAADLETLVFPGGTPNQIGTFTLRFWFKAPSDATDSWIASAGGHWILATGPGGAFYIVDEANTFYAEPGGSADGSWHHAVIMGDTAAAKLWVAIDGGALSEVAWEWFKPMVYSTQFGLVDNSASGIEYDEIAIYPDYNWTEAEISNDYNGGAGRTYPNVPMP